MIRHADRCPDPTAPPAARVLSTASGASYTKTWCKSCRVVALRPTKQVPLPPALRPERWWLEDYWTARSDSATPALHAPTADGSECAERVDEREYAEHNDATAEVAR